MNISSHFLLDAGILCIALTFILALRAKGNAARNKIESK
tara:strand:- start:240 stop:356 length:117 start_codon:yes stop_codon:yes gene_type:complete